MKNFFILFSIFLIFSCEKKDIIVKRENEPNVHLLNEDDVEMNNAIKKAVETLQEFDFALNSGNSNFYNFSLKKKYEILGGNEHIWISNIHLKNGKYFGYIADEPLSIKNLKIGDSLYVEKNVISDWMYIDGNQLKGGYTVKVLRSRMTNKEKLEMEKQTGLIYD